MGYHILPTTPSSVAAFRDAYVRFYEELSRIHREPTESGAKPTGVKYVGVTMWDADDLLSTYSAAPKRP